MLSQRIWAKSGWEVRELEISKVYEYEPFRRMNWEEETTCSWNFFKATGRSPIAFFGKSPQEWSIKCHEGTLAFGGPIIQGCLKTPTKNHRLVVSTPQPPVQLLRSRSCAWLLVLKAFSIHDWTDLDLLLEKGWKRSHFFGNVPTICAYLCPDGVYVLPFLPISSHI